MALRVSIQQAAANALSAWLKRQLPDVVFYDRWPEPSVDLFDEAEQRTKVASIVITGKPEDLTTDPVLVSQTEDGPVNLTVVWRYACRRQRIHLNVWTMYEVDRDDIAARLEEALNASETDSLGVANSEAVRSGLLLTLSDDWEGRAEFIFDPPENIDTPDSNQQSEFRALFSGYADFMYTRTRTVPSIELLTFKQKAHQTIHAPTLYTDIATVNGEGQVVYSEVPPA